MDVMFIKVHLRIFYYAVNVGIYETVKGRDLFPLNFLSHSRSPKMSRDESVEKIKNIITYGWHIDRSDKGIAQDIYDAGFRDITDLRNWLDEKNKEKIEEETYKSYRLIRVDDVLKKLESL